MTDTHPASTDSPAEGGAVAWRYRSIAPWSDWSLTSHKPTNEAIIERPNVFEVQPLYTRPAPIEPGVREKADLWRNPEDWDCTHMDPQEAYEAATNGRCQGVVRLSRATQLTDVWAVQINIDTTGDGEADDSELRLFSSKAEAEKYLADALLSSNTGER